MSSSEERGREVNPKTWTTLVAKAALKGFQLWRTDAADGPTRYFLARWGRVRAMADTDEVERILDVVGAQ